MQKLRGRTPVTLVDVGPTAKNLEIFKDFNDMKIVWLLLVLISITLFWSFLGIAQDGFYEESYNVFFVKKTPTFQIFFVNLTLTEANIPPLQDWPKERLDKLKEYCHYRFGINDFSFRSLDYCANLPHRSNNWIAEWYVGT